MLGPEWGKSLAYREKTSWKPPRKSSVDFQFTLWPKARKNFCWFGTLRSVEIECCTSASKGRGGTSLLVSTSSGKKPSAARRLLCSRFQPKNLVSRHR